MEEDIEILENFIKYFEEEAISRKYRRNISITVSEDDIQAIENLIARNEELEEKDKANEAIKKAYREVIDDKGYISKSKIEKEFERMTSHSNCFNLGDMNDLLDRILN